jgi:hypothetical protein
LTNAEGGILGHGVACVRGRAQQQWLGVEAMQSGFVRATLDDGVRCTGDKRRRKARQLMVATRVLGS